MFGIIRKFTNASSVYRGSSSKSWLQVFFGFLIKAFLRAVQFVLERGVKGSLWLDKDAETEKSRLAYEFSLNAFDEEGQVTQAASAPSGGSGYHGGGTSHPMGWGR